ncbi:MAG: hypothetical protein Q4F41_17630 [Eubacteriales bacterium]|nr:hypothetical protein [Eubacteriales bacterium]
MKKKFSAMILAAALAAMAGTTALAESTTVTTNESSTITKNGYSGNTTVSYTVEANDYFVVTVPASVVISSDTKTAELTVSLDGSQYETQNKKFEVNLTGGIGINGKEFYLKMDDTNSVQYTITKSDNSVLTASSGSNNVLTWNSSNTEKTVSETLTLTLSDTDSLAAGTYTARLDFTVFIN